MHITFPFGCNFLKRFINKGTDLDTLYIEEQPQLDFCNSILFVHGREAKFQYQAARAMKLNTNIQTLKIFDMLGHKIQNFIS